jgi:hypothetical protein
MITDTVEQLIGHLDSSIAMRPVPYNDDVGLSRSQLLDSGHGQLNAPVILSAVGPPVR